MSYLLISDCLHRNHLCWLCRIMDGSESTQVYSFWWRTRYSEQTPKHFQLYPCSVLSQYVIHSANGARGTPSMLRTSILVGEGGQCASERWTGLQLLISALDSAPDSATDFSSQESKRGRCGREWSRAWSKYYRDRVREGLTHMTQVYRSWGRDPRNRRL